MTVRRIDDLTIRLDILNQVFEDAPYSSSVVNPIFSKNLFSKEYLAN